MKKLKLFTLALSFLIGAGAGAQMKAAFISIDNMVALMPETGKIDSLLDRYQADSLQPRYNYTLSEYLRKDSIVSGKDSAKTKLVPDDRLGRCPRHDAAEYSD